MPGSKTPNPNQNSSVYDENLLVDAPQATRAQLREGYDVDLLEGGQPQRSRSVRGSAASATPAPPPLTPPPVPGGPLTLAMTRNGSKEQFGESDGDYALKTRRGFWRSRKGIITAVVIVVVIVGAVVGGAVGGTTKGSGGRPPGSSTGESSTSTSAAPAAATSGGSSNSAGSGGEAGQVQPPISSSAAAVRAQ